ncbi:MAG: hypothetical protein JWN98_2124, partial [Abditibacteriota bacterium]|nr:hypothetical protein [Abditibacteriota bacterium]
MANSRLGWDFITLAFSYRAGGYITGY